MTQIKDERREQGEFGRTEGRRRFELIEGLRALAVLAVLAGHGAYAWFPIEESLRLDLASRLGALGVSLFFCISGFVLYRPFILRRGRSNFGASIPSFALRRFVRIAPAYWVALTALAVFPGLPGVFSEQWFAYYGFAQIYSADWAYGGLGQAWTLNVEILFYAALPLYAWVMHARGARTGRRGGRKLELVSLAGVGALSLAIRGWDYAYLENVIHPIGNSLAGTFSWFALGMIVAVVSSTPRHELLGSIARGLGSRPLVSGVSAAAILAVLTAMPVHSPEDSRQVGEVIVETALLGTLGVLLLLVGVFGEKKRLARAVLGNRASVWLGLVSYGVYLWHFPIVAYISDAAFVARFPVPVLAFTVVSLAIVLALAAASFYLLERPLLRWAGSGASRDRRFFVGRKARVSHAPDLGGPTEPVLPSSRPVVASEAQ